MPRLRWFLIGIAVTTFTADYVRLRAQERELQSAATRAEALTVRAQASNTDCLVELAYNKSMIESWEVKTRLITLAQVEALNTLDRAKEGDAEALASLKSVGYSISSPGKKLVSIRYGIGGP